MAVRPERNKSTSREIGLRARSLARGLDGRVFWSDSGLLLVSGEPDFDDLLSCLEGIKKAPEVWQAPTPRQLGFPPTAIMVLTRTELATRGRALQKWRSIRESEMAKRHGAGRRRELDSWGTEIEALEVQLANIYRWCGAFEAGDGLVGSPYLLDEAHDVAIASLVAGIERTASVLPSFSSMMRLAGWLAGADAVRRLVAGFSGAQVALDEAGRRMRFQQLLSMALSLGIHPGCVSGRFRRFIDEKSSELDALDEDASLWTSFARKMTSLFDGLPVGTAFSFGTIDGLLKGDAGDFDEFHSSKWDLLLRSYNEIHRVFAAPLLGELAPSMVALVVCDQSDVPLPVDLFLLGLFNGNRQAAVVEVLHEFRSTSSYPALIDCIGRHVWMDAATIVGVAQLLDAAAKIDDINWFLERYSWIIAMYGRMKIDLGPVRGFLEYFGGSVHVDYNEQCERLLRSIGEIGSSKILASVLGWIRKLGTIRQRSHFVAPLFSVIIEASTLAKRLPSLHRFLQRWTNPPLRCEPITECPPGIPDEAKTWLGRQAFYLELAGETPKIPKSIRTMLDTGVTSDRELAYLAGRAQSGTLSVEQRQRFERLQTKGAKTSVFGPKMCRRLVRKARECCAIAALATLKNELKSATKSLWLEVFGCPCPSYICQSHAVLLSKSAESLVGERKKLLQEVMQAWSNHGDRFREHLSGNDAWLGAARSNGVDVERWLHPASVTVETACGPVVIEAARDPFRYFLMGQYGRTCLRAYEACFPETLLVNAHDANKSLLLVRSEDGEVLGRKLVAIDSSWRLVGFRFYGTSDMPDQSSELEKAVNAYCSSWTELMHVNFSDDGRVPTLAPLHWHDDGDVSWVIPVERLIDCTDGRKDIGTRSQLHSEPGERTSTQALAEVARALLARRRNDIESAFESWNEATTDDGRMEALTALGRLGGPSSMVRLVEDRHLDALSARRVLRILIDYDNPETSRLFVRLFSKSHGNDWWWKQHSDLWLPLAFSLCRKSVCALFDDLVKQGVPSLSSFSLLAAIEFFRRSSPKGLTDSRIKSLLVAPWLQREHRKAIARWLPPFERPQKFLAAALDDDSRRARLDSSTDNLRIGAVLSLRNPCGVAIRHLKDCAQTDPYGLLALSLVEGRRYSVLIERRACELPWSTAAVAALLNITDQVYVQEKLSPTTETPGEHRLFVAALNEFIGAWKRFDLVAVQDVVRSDVLRTCDLDSCEPLVLQACWKYADSLKPDPRIHFRIRAASHRRRQILGTEFDYVWPGVLLGLSRRLSAFGEKSRILEIGDICECFAASRSEVVLPLVRLLTDHKLCGLGTKHRGSDGFALFGDWGFKRVCEAGCATMVFPPGVAEAVDDVGRPILPETARQRIFDDLMLQEREQKLSLPDDIDEARRLARVIATCVDEEALREKPNLMTEFTRRLVEHYRRQFRPH